MGKPMYDTMWQIMRSRLRELTAVACGRCCVEKEDQRFHQGAWDALCLFLNDVEEIESRRELTNGLKELQEQWYGGEPANDPSI
jgi:hypothetical protein